MFEFEPCAECGLPVALRHRVRACGQRIHYRCERDHLTHCARCALDQPDVTRCEHCGRPAAFMRADGVAVCMDCRM